MSNGKRFAHFISSIIINLFVLIIPFLLPFAYNETIYERKAYLAISVFLLNVALTSRLVAFIILLVISILYIALYGTVDTHTSIVSPWCGHSIIVLGAFSVLIFNKYDLHYRKGQPFFSMN